MPITVTVNVKSLMPSLAASVPTGSVVVNGSNQPSGGCALPVDTGQQIPCDIAQCKITISAGIGSCSLKFTQPGPHYFGAVYSGDSVYYSYWSASFATTVNDPSGGTAAAPLMDRWWTCLILGMGLLGLASMHVLKHPG